jgi:MFS family permease
MTSYIRNISLLALCQALMMSCSSLIIATSSLVGFALAPDKSLSTLPLAAQFIAMMLTTIPAAHLLQKIGRKKGFMFATLFGIIGSSLSAVAILNGQFWLFVLGAALIGVYNGFGIYYRFAAADSVGYEYKSRAVSYIMAGGVVAAFVGPNLAGWTRDFLLSASFAGSYASLVILYMVSLFALFFLNLPPEPVLNASDKSNNIRPLRVIAAQPMFIVALICGMLGYGMMVLLMTATPLAMQHCGFLFSDTTFVVQWHVFSMFAPSFVTGHLIRRFGVLNILLAGAILGVVCIVINLIGESVLHFWIALLFLGVSWNFLFIGATTLLTETYCPEERAKTQALNDFVVFTCVAASSLSAGALQHLYGWRAVNLGVIPLLVLILVSILWGKHRCAADNYLENLA